MASAVLEVAGLWKMKESHVPTLLKWKLQTLRYPTLIFLFFASVHAVVGYKCCQPVSPWRSQLHELWRWMGQAVALPNSRKKLTKVSPLFSPLFRLLFPFFSPSESFFPKLTLSHAIR